MEKRSNPCTAAVLKVSSVFTDVKHRLHQSKDRERGFSLTESENLSHGFVCECHFGLCVAIVSLLESQLISLFAYIINKSCHISNILFRFSC